LHKHQILLINRNSVRCDHYKIYRKKKAWLFPTPLAVTNLSNLFIFLIFFPPILIEALRRIHIRVWRKEVSGWRVGREHGVLGESTWRNNISDRILSYHFRRCPDFYRLLWTFRKGIFFSFFVLAKLHFRQNFFFLYFFIFIRYKVIDICL
jgi:hypothetical protein